MQSAHPLLSPRLRRQDSQREQNGRKVWYVGGFFGLVLGVLALYYGTVSQGGPGGRSRPVGASEEAPEASLRSYTDTSAADESPAGREEARKRTPSTFELEAGPFEATMLSSQTATSKAVRASLGLNEDERKDNMYTPEEMLKKSRKALKKKKEKDADGDILFPKTDGQDVSSFPSCDSELTDVVPCLERKLHKKMKLKLTTKLMEHYERHCPSSDYRYRCLVPPPPGYKNPIQWPESRDEVWTANVPHTFLATEKSDQHWMVVEGDKIKFPGGGTHFHNGADKYIENLGKMLGSEEGDLSLGGKIRTVLDVGCGVASFGGYLLSKDIIAISMAPNDVHQNQIQFALERGIPAWLGVLGTQRLPFPSMSFDLAHCSRCRIDWAQRDGVLLTELDRLLRPGGYWAWSAPPAYRDDEESNQIWKEVTDITTRLCWTIAAHEGQTAIFQKPTDGSCYSERSEAQPPICTSADVTADEAWYTPMATCISPMPEEFKLESWPGRLKGLPPRLPDIAMEAYDVDLEVWKDRVSDYLTTIGNHYPDFVDNKNSFRNVMDLSSNLGGFGVAISTLRPVWIMNVAPPNSTTLSTVFDRGMLGMYHDWCEEFSTYPRTYDLLHAWKVIARVHSRGCSVDDLLLELDRIMRPNAYVIFRDTAQYIAMVGRRAGALHWETIDRSDAKDDALKQEEEKVLILRKN